MVALDGSVDWLDDLPLPVGPPDLRMGLRPLDITKWLPVDSNTPAELALRTQLLAEHDGLVRLVPGHDDAVKELMSLAEIHLGRRLDRSAGNALEQLARSIPDDVLLMWRDDTNWRLIGGFVVFPNHWTLEEKLGRTLGNIHAPVDGYEELLESRLDQFFDRLTAARPVWRRNWFFHDDPIFYKPERMRPTALTSAQDAAALWVRSEWQTLRRLAFSGLIVFTVKTQVAPIAQLAARPGAAQKMASFLRVASERSLENKDAYDRDRAIIDYLENPT